MSESYCDSLFTGCHLFTANPDQLIIHDGAIAVKDDIIEWIGKLADLPEDYKTPHKAIYELDGGWITPGLIDCHTHLIYGGNRANEFKQRLDGVSYEAIAKAGGGILSTVKATREASEAALILSAASRLETLMNEGVTTVEIKSGYGLDLESEIKMLKVAEQLGENYPVNIIKTLLSAHALPSEYKHTPDDYITLICDKIMPEAKRQKLVDAVDGFCENIGFSTTQIEKVFKRAIELDIPVKLHAEQLSNQGGAALAASYKALSADHLEYLDETGVLAMAKSGTVAVLLPGAYYFLSETKLPPIDLLRKHQVPIAIATDSNPGSSPCTSLLLMLNMGCTLFKLTVEEALLGVTREAAKALGINESHGQLIKGLHADFVNWAVEAPEELVYQFGHNPARLIVKSGKVT